ncbi:MAG: lipid II:glycine glycyltransferase FemX [Sphaerochaeta sp.]|uniref:lipid II:glycine glycyltransferase FemX n=1 Tax=Sphaerochaeta sp. TaxID=1972642 RepID=UPI002FC9E460
MAMVVRLIDYKQFPCTTSVLQSSFWAAVKHGTGWMPYAFSVEDESYSFSLLVLVKQVLPLMSLAYVPFAPPLDVLDRVVVHELLRSLSKQLKKLLPHGVFALRFDLPFDGPNEENVLVVSGPRLHACRESVQPEGTVRIDLRAGYAAVTEAYRERAKRALRKAGQAFEVGLYGGDDPAFKRWYDVYLETAKRDGFSPRSAKYLKALLNLDGKVHADVACKLLLATQKRKIVGGIIVVFGPSEALYLYGASLRFDGLSCAHLLQDYAIRMACERSCAFYDLYGISGPSGRGAHLAGLEIFKLSFGGQCYYRTPSTDYVYALLPWRFYTLLEHMRYRMNRQLKSQEGVPPNS